MEITLKPAYGRDYTSSQKVLEAFLSGEDFVVSSDSGQWAGKHINRPQIEGLEADEVTIRYDARSRTVVLRRREDGWEIA